jgi:hypothetical protein
MEDKIMKRITIVLMIFFTVSLVGGLYRVFSQLDNVGKQRTYHAYMEQLPNKMPNVLPEPMTGLPLY